MADKREVAKFQTGTGVEFLAETVEPDFGTLQFVSARRDPETAINFTSALDRVKPVAETLIEKLRDLAVHPDAVEIQFGIKLSGSVGALIASTGTEANFQIKMTWNRKSP